MIGDVRDVLRSPRAFFRREVEEPSAREPAVIVGTVALVGAGSRLVVTQMLAANLPEEVRALLFAVQLAVELVGTFVVWLLYAAVFFGISALLGGEGSFRRVALLTAWGFVPRVIASLADFVASTVATRGIDPGELDSAADFQELSSQLAAHPAALAASVVGIVMLVWSAYIWVAAMQEARRLDRGEAIVTVAIPVGIALLIRLLGLLGAVA